MRASSKLRRFLDAWPGKRTLGMYRFLPIFFTLGASVEFSMINWHAGEVNFYYIRMPAGVTWGAYLRFGTVAMLTMFAGSQMVHMIYKPLEDMEEFIEKERINMLKEAEEAKKAAEKQS